MLSAALVGLTVAIIVTEIRRLFRGFKGIKPVELTQLINAGGTVVVDLSASGDFEKGHIAGSRNAQLRRYPSAALFEGEIADLFTRERLEGRQETTDRQGRLEMVENRRTWLCLELEDEDGYLGQLRFPLEKGHKALRRGMTLRCLVLSERKDFSRIDRISDAWVPQARLWAGEYPYLLRPAFEELCLRRLA